MPSERQREQPDAPPPPPPPEADNFPPPRQSLIQLAERAWQRYTSLSENAQVLVGSGAILSVLVVLLLIYLYWTIIWKIVAIILLVQLGVASFRLYMLLKRRPTPEHNITEHSESLSPGGVHEERRVLVQFRRHETAIAPPSHTPGLLPDAESIWHKSPAWAIDSKHYAFPGHLYVTASRVVFRSNEFPIEIPVAKITKVRHITETLTIKVKTQSDLHTFLVDDPEISREFIVRAVNTNPAL